MEAPKVRCRFCNGPLSIAVHTPSGYPTRVAIPGPQGLSSEMPTRLLRLLAAALLLAGLVAGQDQRCRCEEGPLKTLVGGLGWPAAAARRLLKLAEA